MQQQEQFHEYYITGSEIMTELQISRAALLYARRSGRLPGAIEVNNGYVWKRKEILPHIETWKNELNERRGIAA